MFPADFADVWSPVVFSHTLKANKPLARKLAGVDLVVFRGRDGKAGALIDRCPHRGVKLSLGKVTEDGCLKCPFHGWEFQADGSCAHVPFSPQLDELKRRNLGASALPVVERAGVVFVFTGIAPVGEPFIPAALLRDDVTRAYSERVWATHWTRAMENMLDSPHLPFVHGSTIGRGIKSRVTRDAVMEIEVAETPAGFRSRMIMKVDGRVVEGNAGEDVLSEKNAFLDWNRPNGMTLNIPVPSGQWRQHMWCVPIDDTHVNMMLVTTRSFGRWNPFLAIADRANGPVMNEDKAIIESSPTMVPAASQEKSVATDKATLMFRKWVRGRVDGAAEVERPTPLRLIGG